jgi:hypothetical protein
MSSLSIQRDRRESCRGVSSIPLKKGGKMPEKSTLERARKDKEEGKSPSTQAGEFVREEMDHIREGKHGARSTKQAIAIGLSKARRSGVALKPPKKGKTSESTRKSAQRDLAKGRKGSKTGAKKKSAARSRATTLALKGEPRQAASKPALSRQAKTAARKRKQSGPVSSGTRSSRTRTSSAQRRAA